MNRSTSTPVSPTFLVQSGDWQAPLDFDDRTRGVLITRLEKGVYGVYKYGQWRKITAAEWEVQYATPIPAGLPTGWWGLLDKVRYSGGTYQEPFDGLTLEYALSKCEEHIGDEIDYRMQLMALRHA